MTPAEFRAARETLGLTQAQLASLLGYGHAMRVSEVERGVRVPSERVLRSLRSFLDGYRPPDWPGVFRARE